MGRPKSPDSETLVARQMFLYGEGDGQRIVNVPELSEKSGCGQETIRKWLPKWNEELEEQLKSSTKLASPNILSLPEEVLEAHKADLTFIRSQMDLFKAEIDAIDAIHDKLFSVVENLSHSPDSAEDATQLFDRFLRLSMNKKSLLKQFSEMMKLWDDKCGVDSQKNIQESTAKAVSLANAKNAQTENEPVKGKVVDSGVFRRRI